MNNEFIIPMNPLFEHFYFWNDETVANNAPELHYKYYYYKY